MDKTYLQCQYCGHIYTVEHLVDSEALYIQSYCPKCGNTTALNLGPNADDIYIYINVNFF